MAYRSLQALAVLGIVASITGLLKASEFSVTSIASVEGGGQLNHFSLVGSVEGNNVFTAYDGPTQGLYSTNGIAIRQIGANGFEWGSVEKLRLIDYGSIPYYGNFTSFGNALYFVANGDEGRTLYKTDGSSLEPVMAGVDGVTDYDVRIPPTASISQDFLYFTKNVGDFQGLYKTDGTSVSPVATSVSDSSSTSFVTAIDGYSILHAAPFGRLFKESRQGQSEILLGSNSEGDWFVGKLRDNAVFSSRVGNDLYLYSVDSAGAVVNKALFSNANGFGPERIVVGDLMYFMGKKDDYLERLFVTDGKEVKLFNVGTSDHSQTNFLTGVGDDLYMFIYAQRRVVRTDGVGVFEIDVDVREDVLGARLLGTVGEALLLDMQVANIGMTNTRTRGLFYVEDDVAHYIDTGSPGGYLPSNLTIVGSDIYFTGLGANGDELFRLSNGQLKEFDINPLGNSSPTDLTVLGDVVYFSATGSSGRELYALKDDDLHLIDINPAGSSSPWIVGANGDALLVQASGMESRLFAVRSQVPEPTSLAITAVATLSLLCFRRPESGVPT